MAAPRMLTHDGRTMSIAAWARELGVSKQALSQRVRRADREGRDPAEAIAEPARAGHGRPGRMLTRDGRTQTLSAWARELGIHPSALYHRIAHVGVERALSAPRRSMRSPTYDLTYDGRTQSMSAWAAEMGLALATLSVRVREWGVERALSTPRCHAPTRDRAITYQGRTQSAARWAAEIGISKSTLLGRIERWGVERALSTPPMVSGTRTDGAARRRMARGPERSERRCRRT